MVLSALAGALRAQDPKRMTISIDAESSSLDRLSNRARFQGLRIAIEQENIVISAADAMVEGLDGDNSHWQLSGNVNVTLDRAELSADSATFVFGNDQVITGELAGAPATFEAQAAGNEDPVVGTASRVYYDNSAGTVRLEGGVALTAGPNRITGCDVIYDLNQETVNSGVADCGEPFRITIVPPAEDPPPAAP